MQGVTLKPYEFNIGDYVRISHLRNAFTGAYDETYSGEVFKVHNTCRYHRGILLIYKLRDLQDEDISRTFYHSELQKIYINPDQRWKLDKVLKTRANGLNKQYFVKWKYYPKKFNSWINASNLNWICVKQSAWILYHSFILLNLFK